VQADGAATDVQLMRAAVQERRLNHRIEVTEECTEMLTTFFCSEALPPARHAGDTRLVVNTIDHAFAWFVVRYPAKAVPILQARMLCLEAGVARHKSTSGGTGGDSGC
jgi:hypothetical protein